ncbi:MAG: ASPIC/UnbV domain-containing protein [Verrucomicrobiales bacterium]|nr:ASPIC/UnbV domain-containing protein [Verrucomicrobiales bacterium]
MSHSPVTGTEIRSAAVPDSEFRAHLAKVNKLLRDGLSMSGEERNCVFLNTRGRRFATISATSGFDFPDDARAIAMTDWDLDGDLDVWVSNRTAPRVRFLRNDLPPAAQRRFLGLRLEGRTVNRDAIGARVELKFKDRPDVIRTLRAGEGFLGQSSKWLHFGVGEANELDRVVVRWPGAEAQTFSGLELDQYHVLVQGAEPSKSMAESDSRSPLSRGKRKPLEPSVPKVPKATEQASLLLTDRLPVPPLSIRSFAGETLSLSNSLRRPVLLNLWASWCAPCLAELKEMTAHADELKALDLQVIAVALDGQDESQTTTPADAQALLKQLNFPFQGGIPTNDFIARLQSLYDLPFAQHRPMPVPTSFLIDSQGMLAAVYRGPVTLEKLRSDLRLLAGSPRTLIDQVLPFPGSWHRIPQPRPDKAILMALELMKAGALDDAVWYVRQHVSSFSGHPEYPKLIAWAGGELARAKRMTESVSIYQAGLSVSPTNLLLLNNLAWDLAAHPDPAMRDGASAVVWAEKAAQLTNRRDVTVLDTLGASYAQAGRFADAVAALKDAIELVKISGDEGRRIKLQRNLELYESRKSFR